MLADILRTGCTLAHQKVGLIFLDVLWKTIWVALTVAAFTVALLWFSSGLSGIEWEDTGVPAVNGLIASVVIRDYWNANRESLVLTALTLLSGTIVIWVLLEASFRRKIVHVVAGFGARSNVSFPFKVFLASGAVKHAVLITSAFALAWVSLKGALTIAIVTFAAIAFFLTLLDTLVRSDAVDLLGTDLIRVAGLLGILMLFEGLVAASFLTILVAGFLNVAGATDAVVMLAASVVVVVFLNLLHGYLLLVRFSTIAIMRRNVVEV